MKKFTLLTMALLMCVVMFAQKERRFQPIQKGPQSALQQMKLMKKGIAQQATRRADAEVVTPPEGLVTADYVISARNYKDNADVAVALKIGFVDNDIYVQGLCSYLPESWCKGTLDGTTATFAKGQYFGNYGGSYDMYLNTLMDKDVVFTYDAEYGTFTAQNEFFLTCNDEYFFDSYRGAVITKVVEKAATPANPSITSLENSNYGYILNFNVPIADTEGNALLASKLSYIIYTETNGEVAALTFTSATHSKLTEDMTEIPYGFTDNYDFYASSIYLNDLYSADWTKIGIKSIYTGGGETHESEIGWLDLKGEEPEGGLVTPPADATIETWYTTGGNFYVNTSSGMQDATSKVSSIQVAFSGDDIYLQGLAYWFKTAWIKGTNNGGTITFPSGQLVGSDDYGDEFIVGTADGETITDIVFTYDATAGTLTNEQKIVESGSASEIQAFCYWQSPVFSKTEPVGPEVVELPEGTETTDMPMTGLFYASMDDYQNEISTPVEATVKVAQVDDQIYIQGLVQKYPQAWVKGTLADDVITIPVSNLGEDATSGAPVYAMGYSSSGPAPIKLMYDAETKAMEVDGYVMISSSWRENTMDGIYQALFIGERPAVVVAPEDIVTETMPASGTIYDGQAESEYAAEVKVGFYNEGADLYIQGLIDKVPEGWIKATLNTETGNYVIPMGQYVGASSYGSVYVLGDNVETEAPADIEFTYDANKNSLTLVNNLYINGKKNAFYYYGILESGLIIGTDCDEIWVAANQGYENAQEITAFDITEDKTITATVDKGKGSTTPKYYNTGTSLRLYGGNTLTITSAQEIGKIEFVFDTSKDPAFDVSTGTFAQDETTGKYEWNGQATEITFTVPTGTQSRIQKILIWYFDYSTTTVTVPDGLVTEIYDFAAFDTYYEKNVTKQVQVGFVDNEVYIQGLSDYITDAWVKGTLDAENNLVIPGWFLGTYASFFGDMDLVFSGATFVYDATANTFTSTEGFQTIADGYAMDEYANVVLTKFNEVAATPAQPSIDNFIPDGSYPKINCTIPATDAEGNNLNREKLWYVIWIKKDGARSQLTLTTAEYANLTEDMTEIPYTFTDDWDIYAGGTTVYLNQSAEEIATWTNIGVQSIYRGAGEEHKSAIAWYKTPTTGVSDIKSTANDKLNGKFFENGRMVIMKNGIRYNAAGQRMK